MNKLCGTQRREVNYNQRGKFKNNQKSDSVNCHSKSIQITGIIFKVKVLYLFIFQQKRSFANEFCVSFVKRI